MSVYDYSAKTIDGKERSLADFKGQVLLIVNVASKCGFTPQYKGLESLHRRYRNQKFTVLGFPCDQFANQEPGSDEEIMQFCGVKYDVTFPMFAKVEVNGDDAHPLYQYLKSAQKGILGTESIKWNFTKFLVDADGTVLERYAPKQTPEEIEPDIIPLLG